MLNKQVIENKNLGENKSKVWVGKDGIVNVETAKITDEKEIEQLLEEMEKIIGKMPGKAKVLINLTITTNIIRSSQFRKKTVERVKKIAKDPGFEKAALFVGNLVMRTIASFIIAAAGLQNVKIFPTREEALKWLKK